MASCIHVSHLMGYNHAIPKSFYSQFAEDDVVQGNMGMLDQVEALKWVQKNIAGNNYLVL